MTIQRDGVAGRMTEHPGELHDPALNEPSCRAANPSAKDMDQIVGGSLRVGIQCWYDWSDFFIWT